MTKTNTTKTLELAIHKLFDSKTASIAHEVKIGNLKTQNLITDKTEIVDVIAYKNDGTFYCFEVKSSKADFDSMHSLSFYGDYNYLVLPSDVVPLIQDSDKYRKLLFQGIGVYVYTDGKLTNIRKAKKKTPSVSIRTILLESMVRSLARDALKYYNS